MDGAITCGIQNCVSDHEAHAFEVPLLIWVQAVKILWELHAPLNDQDQLHERWYEALFSLSTFRVHILHQSSHFDLQQAGKLLWQRLGCKKQIFISHPIVFDQTPSLAMAVRYCSLH